LTALQSRAAYQGGSFLKPREQGRNCSERIELGMREQSARASLRVLAQNNSTELTTVERGHMIRTVDYRAQIKANSDSIEQRRSDKIAEWCKENTEAAAKGGCGWVVLLPFLPLLYGAYRVASPFV
jgi:hypothetical protein